MPDGWYPGAVRNPGGAAGYTRGRAMMSIVVAHYTVGVRSDGVGLAGYFQFLVRRDGEVVQFAEADAVCWHAGHWNMLGPGIEVEYLPGHDDTVFTDAQRDATGALVRWLHDEWGIPLDYYDGPRVKVAGTPAGVVAHGSLDQAPDNHTDGWPREDWDLMVNPALASGAPTLPPISGVVTMGYVRWVRRDDITGTGADIGHGHTMDGVPFTPLGSLDGVEPDRWVDIRESEWQRYAESFDYKEPLDQDVFAAKVARAVADEAGRRLSR